MTSSAPYSVRYARDLPLASSSARVCATPPPASGSPPPRNCSRTPSPAQSAAGKTRAGSSLSGRSRPIAGYRSSLLPGRFPQTAASVPAASTSRRTSPQSTLRSSRRTLAVAALRTPVPAPFDAAQVLARVQPQLLPARVQILVLFPHRLPRDVIRMLPVDVLHALHRKKPTIGQFRGPIFESSRHSCHSTY